MPIINFHAPKPLLVYIYFCCYIFAILFTYMVSDLFFIVFLFFFSLCGFPQQEHDEIEARKRDVEEPLDWSDYKSMPFTQCVSIHVNFFQSFYFK